MFRQLVLFQKSSITDRTVKLRFCFYPDFDGLTSQPLASSQLLDFVVLHTKDCKIDVPVVLYYRDYPLMHVF
jgi:hypothetical protein